MTILRHVITETTDREWADNHPFRKLVNEVLTNEQAEAVGACLICARREDFRASPLNAGTDVHALCWECGEEVMHRASAPRLKPICLQCWTRIGS